jgi:hypothetical protein
MGVLSPNQPPHGFFFPFHGPNKSSASYFLPTWSEARSTALSGVKHYLEISLFFFFLNYVWNRDPSFWRRIYNYLVRRNTRKLSTNMTYMVGWKVSGILQNEIVLNSFPRWIQKSKDKTQVWGNTIPDWCHWPMLLGKDHLILVTLIRFTFAMTIIRKWWHLSFYPITFCSVDTFSHLYTARSSVPFVLLRLMKSFFSTSKLSSGHEHKVSGYFWTISFITIIFISYP